MKMKLHYRVINAVALLTVTQVVVAQHPINELKRQTFEIVWTTVKEKHFDPTLNGIDWEAVHRRYAPLVAAAQSDDEFYRLLNQMLRELKQSHFAVIPPSFYVQEDIDNRYSRADVGITVHEIEGRPTITQVEPNSPAFSSQLRPGFVVTHIDGESLDELQRKIAARPERAVVRSSLLLRSLRTRLRGKAGSAVTLRYFDENDSPRTVTITRNAPDGQVARFADLPTPLARLETRRLTGDIGYLRFSLFVLPLLSQLRQAVRSFHDALGIILDLRGNSGGEIAVTTALAGMFCTEPTSLGTTRLRQGELYRPVLPQPDAYTGPLVILTDAGTFSAAETFAAAMQENGRAKIVGGPTIGGALPSVIEILPTGARLQYAIGEYRTPKGIVLEGRGVQPDARVEVTRRELLAGRDPALEKAVSLLLEQQRKKISNLGSERPIEHGEQL